MTPSQHSKRRAAAGWVMLGGVPKAQASMKSSKPYDAMIIGGGHNGLVRDFMLQTDLEQIFGLVGGDIFHGALTLDQLFSARPILGYGNYRGPLKGLYLCGAGTRPGGGVSGIPGHNAARGILRDR